MKRSLLRRFGLTRMRLVGTVVGLVLGYCAYDLIVKAQPVAPRSVRERVKKKQQENVTKDSVAPAESMPAKPQD